MNEGVSCAVVAGCGVQVFSSKMAHFRPIFDIFHRNRLFFGVFGAKRAWLAARQAKVVSLQIHRCKAF